MVHSVEPIAPLSYPDLKPIPPVRIPKLKFQPIESIEVVNAECEPL
jgi:hypothetical protein